MVVSFNDLRIVVRTPLRRTLLKRVQEYLADLLKKPFRPALENDDKGVFSLKAVPRTNVGLGWTLNMTTKEIVLFHVG